MVRNNMAKTKKTVASGFNKELEQWWTEFIYDDKTYFAIWGIGTKDGLETFDVGFFPSSDNKESIKNGFSKRTNGKKKQDATSTGKNEKSRS